MAKIHGIAYLIIGIMILGLSYYIGQTKEGFKIFIYAGLLMIIIGIIKLAIQRARSKKETKPSHHAATHKSAYRPLYCTRCGAVINPTDKFCYNCGNRIRR